MDIMKIVMDVLIVAPIIFVIIAIAQAIDEKSKYERIYQIKKKDKDGPGLLEELLSFGVVKRYHNTISIRMKEMGKEDSMGFVFNASMMFMLVSSVFLIAMKQYFLALLVPFILMKFFTYLMKLVAKDIIEDIEKTMPLAIDNIIRISSKYSDIRTILYEASVNTPEPLGSIFGDISRRMMSTPQEEVLMEFAEKYDNVWIYSFVLILISYMEDANQEETLKNLKNLRDMLERENFLMSKKISENRYGVVINYTVAALAFVAFIANLTLNPYGKEFFFSTMLGLISFFIGMGSLLFTVVVNIKLLHQKKK